MAKDAVTKNSGGFFRFLLRFIFGVALPVAVLFVGGKAALDLYETGPKAERKPSHARNARLVEVITASRSTESTVIHANGTVCPAQTIQLQPRVSGEIIKVSPELIPGGRFRAGEAVLSIDPTDYDLILRQRTAAVAEAESQYQLELGNQSVAQREYELLGETISEEDRDLVLRQPQLRAVEATLNVAKAVLEKAELDLERTTIRAPFNAQVEMRNVNLGTQVTTQTSLATLVGTDEYWIELSVRVDELAWIQIPQEAKERGSLVRVYNNAAWGGNVHRMGRIIRLIGTLEEEARMARLLVVVPDPLGISGENGNRPVLLINSYVTVEIEGLSLENVVALDRRYLRDGEFVWILDPEGLLEIRPVTIAFSGRSRVLISEGIDASERIVTTDLAAPVNRMPLRTEDEE